MPFDMSNGNFSMIPAGGDSSDPKKQLDDALGKIMPGKKPAGATTPAMPNGSGSSFSRQTPEQRQALLQAMVARSRGGSGGGMQGGGVGGLA